METDNLIPLEHQNVPQAHQGLHGFLYSSDDEHSVSEPAIAAPVLSTETVVSLTDWCEPVGTAKIAGVYSVLNRDRQTQYIGYSRNVALSLRGHLTQLGEDICAFVRVQTFDFPKRDDMEALQNSWIAELGTVPPATKPLKNCGQLRWVLRRSPHSILFHSNFRFRY